MVEKIKVFFNDAKGELLKVAWPDKKTAIASTVVVLGLSLVMGIYLSVMDFVIGKVIKFILS